MDGLSASPGNFRAELWVAKDGEYPVSGFFGFDVPGQGSYGYRFDITHVNDPANIITAPTDIVPTPAPTRTPIPDATGVSNVVAWGDDIWGQTDVPHGLSDAVAVAVGGKHTLALRRDGTVVAWGLDVEGETHFPAGLSGVVAIAAADQISLALKKDGTVVAWGSPDMSKVPPGLSHVVAISAGPSYSLALKSDGRVVGWGAWPANVPAGLSNVMAIAAATDHSLALKTDGTVVAWGYIDFAPAYVPVGLSGVIAISAAGGLAVVAGTP